MPTIPEIQAVLDDPCASYWLKDSLRLMLKSDPCDFNANVCILQKLADAHLNAVFADAH